jgi:hypothetical protein
MAPSCFTSHPRGRCAANFYRPEKSIALARFEYTNFGSSGKHTNHYTTKGNWRTSLRRLTQSYTTMWNRSTVCLQLCASPKNFESALFAQGGTKVMLLEVFSNKYLLYLFLQEQTELPHEEMAIMEAITTSETSVYFKETTRRCKLPSSHSPPWEPEISASYRPFSFWELEVKQLTLSVSACFESDPWGRLPVSEFPSVSSVPPVL